MPILPKLFMFISFVSGPNYQQYGKFCIILNGILSMKFFHLDKFRRMGKGFTRAHQNRKYLIC